MLHVPFTADRLLLKVELTEPRDIVSALAGAIRKAPGLPPEPDAAGIAELAIQRDDDGVTRRLGRDAVLLHIRLDGMDGARIALCTLAEPIAWTDGGEASFVADSVTFKYDASFAFSFGFL